MVSLTALWLPILVSAVLAFVASSILHLVLKYHSTDYRKLPDEEVVVEAMRRANVPRGAYMFPAPDDPKDFATPEMRAKFEKGPVGILLVRSSGPPAMGKYMVQWFLFCLLVSVFSGYVAAHALGAGTEYLEVFRIVGTVAFMGYAFGDLVDTIWKSQQWSTTLKNLFDGLVYALLTAGVFGWLWPS